MSNLQGNHPNGDDSSLPITDQGLK